MITKLFYRNTAPLQSSPDTGSFIYHIQAPDFYKDMAENLDAYDTSDCPNDRPLYSRNNAEMLDRMKDECSRQAPHEFAGLRSNIYSILLPQNKSKLLQLSRVNIFWNTFNWRIINNLVSGRNLKVYYVKKKMHTLIGVQNEQIANHCGNIQSN